MLFHAVFVPQLIGFASNVARDLSLGLVSEASFIAAVDHVCCPMWAPMALRTPRVLTQSLRGTLFATSALSSRKSA